MKRGRYLYENLTACADEAMRLRMLHGWKGRDLVALDHYAAGLGMDDTERDEITGLMLVVAAERYLRRAEKKAEKKARRAKRIL